METITVQGIEYPVVNDCVTISGWVEMRLRREIRKELRRYLAERYQKEEEAQLTLSGTGYAPNHILGINEID